MTQTFYQYSYLQLLDFLTTVAFLLNGVDEGNPVVAWAIRMSPSPLAGLAAIKIVALALGVYCWQTAKARLLGRINVAFAVLIAWNLFSLILKTVR
jgi:hypothetical protein